MSEAEKREFVESKGWEMYYNPDNWIHRVKMAGANLDWCGVDLETAYAICLKDENKVS